MAMSREDMLRELELLPAWKLREPVAANLAPARLESAKRQSAIAEPVSTISVEKVPNIESAVPYSESVPAIENMDIATAKSVTESMQAVILEPTIKPAEIEEKAELFEARVNVIKHMDWQALQSCVKDCQACNLAATRTQTVFGVGDPNAEWLIVGEAPGAQEDLKGEPFVGQAGKLLDNMLAAIQLKRGDNVFIANVLKCRPPENRDPLGEEVRECDPFLKRQVELIKPKLIIALGKFAAQSLLQSENTIASMRGQLHQYNDVPVIVTYHPAYLLRNLADKAKAWEDLCFAKRTMQSL